MTQPSRLAVRPQCCTRCGQCVKACPSSLIKIGGGYVYVDVAHCSGCFECVSACESGAIVKASSVRAATKPAAASRSGPGKHAKPSGEPAQAKVIVGSRAEAKALRQVAGKPAPVKKPVVKPAARSKPGGRAYAAPKATGTAWTLAEAAAVAAVLLALLALKDFALSSRYVAVMPAEGKVAATTLVMALFYAGQLGLLFALAGRRGESFAESFRVRVASGWSTKGALVSVGLVMSLTVATRAASMAWGALAQAVGWSPPGTGSLTGLFGGGALGFSLTVLMAVIIGPLTEEAAFRGVIAPAFEHRWGRRVAIVVSAALFAAYHVTPWMWVPMFVFGAVLSWLALERQTLWPAIVLHAVYNGLVVGAAFWLAR